MNILAIDTSTKYLSLAIYKSGKVSLSRQTKLEILSDSIIPVIDKALKSAKLTLNKIDAFAIGLGPGSFTSLRVGVSTIKGFALANPKPIVGIVSLDTIALAAEGHKNICVITDAKRSLIYACIYTLQGDNLKKQSDYLLVPIEDVLKLIKEETLFIGDAVTIYKGKIKNALRKKAIFADDKLGVPQAKNMIPLALKKLESNKSDNAAKLVPLYLYPEDCQVQR